MLSLVPWVASQGSVSIDEICRRFAISRQQLLADLTTVSMVGLYPYTPDALILLFIEDDTVSIELPQAFDRPLSLTPEQAFALVGAGAAILATPGADSTGPLARGLAKLSAVLAGNDGVAGSEIDVRLAPVSDTVLELLRQAVSSRHQVTIDYYAYGRDEITHRTIDPYRVTSTQGQWYVSAYCHLAHDERLFRVDRIRDASVLETTFEPSIEEFSSEVFNTKGDDPRVELVLSAEARWVLEQYPIESSVDLSDGSCRVTIAVAAKPWLERLLLRLGDDAEVLSGPLDLRQAGSDAAARVLRRYEQSQ